MKVFSSSDVACHLLCRSRLLPTVERTMTEWEIMGAYSEGRTARVYRSDACSVFPENIPSIRGNKKNVHGGSSSSRTWISTETSVKHIQSPKKKKQKQNHRAKHRQEGDEEELTSSGTILTWRERERETERATHISCLKIVKWGGGWKSGLQNLNNVMKDTGLGDHGPKILSHVIQQNPFLTLWHLLFVILQSWCLCLWKETSPQDRPTAKHSRTSLETLGGWGKNPSGGKC